MCLPVYFQNAIDLKELIEKYAVVLKAEQEGDAYDISSAKLEMYHLQYKQLCRGMLMSRSCCYEYLQITRLALRVRKRLPWTRRWSENLYAYFLA